MATVIEQPPQPKPGLGCCLGKGCLILVVLCIFLVLALACGAYFGLRTFTSEEPREIPQVETSEEQQQAVLQRWDNFQNRVSEFREASSPSEENPTPQTTTTPNLPPAKPTIQLSAGDINQLISANRRSRGKAFVSIENSVGHVAVSIPVSKKIGFSGRYLNADFEVRSAENGDVGGIQISARSPGGVQVPSRLLNLLLGARSIRGWVDPYISQYRSEYDVSTFKIVGNSVVLEAGRPR